MKRIRTELMLCGGTGCHSTGSRALKEALIQELKRQGLAEEVQVVETGCNGFCAVGPVMLVLPEGVFYQRLKVEDVPELVEQHLLKGTPLESRLYVDLFTKKIIPHMKDIPFFANQMFWVMRNKGYIDPEKIDEYIGRGGYRGAAKALKEMTPEAVIAEVKTSGLRGRGGAGFPTGLKWEFARKSPGALKYVLCNADEGDPGAFMDRSILEADPHAVLEGMVIAARAIDAHQGYIYCRTEYPLAIRRLGIAIEQAKAYGLLGRRHPGFGLRL